MSESVNHPSHYLCGNSLYEVINVLQAWMTPEQLDGFCRGNVIKYVSRAGKKMGESKLYDLRKAQWYLNYMVTKEEENDDNAV